MWYLSLKSTWKFRAWKCRKKELSSKRWRKFALELLLLLLSKLTRVCITHVCHCCISMCVCMSVRKKCQCACECHVRHLPKALIGTPTLAKDSHTSACSISLAYMRVYVCVKCCYIFHIQYLCVCACKLKLVLKSHMLTTKCT